MRGYTDARAEVQDPASAFIKNYLAVCLYYAGDIETSNWKFDEALNLAPYQRLILRYAIVLAAQEKDTARVRQLIQLASDDKNALPDYARPLLQLLEGDRHSLRDLVESWHSNLEDTYVYSHNFTQMYYFLGDYKNHFHWFAVQEDEYTTLHLTNMFLVGIPNYWENLEAWVDKDPDQQAERRTLLDDHRARIARVTEKMVL